jgi:hypothetical protein
MVDIPTAKHHGVCPVCEGYGGRSLDGLTNAEYLDYTEHDCEGSCAKCWCSGCHDGWSGPAEMGEEAFGSWEAYELVQSLGVGPNQLAIGEGAAE